MRIIIHSHSDLFDGLHIFVGISGSSDLYSFYNFILEISTFNFILCDLQLVTACFTLKCYDGIELRGLSSSSSVKPCFLAFNNTLM